MIDGLKEFYRNKKILVTGHTGFKGGWLSIWLTWLGAKVTGYSLAPPSNPNFFEAIDLPNQTGITDIRGDIRDFSSLQNRLAEFGPEMVFHLAAQPLVRRSYDDPRLTYETNVMGTVNVLEAVRHSPSVRVIINITSDKCYENKEWVWGYRENDPIGGHDPYSSSKGCAELVTAAYRQSFFSRLSTPDSQLPTFIASTRAGNVIGGGDWGEDRLIPDCIRALSQNRDIIIRYPKACRPWQHVLEPLGGYLLLGTKLWTNGGHYARAWNFGPSDKEAMTVEEVVRAIIRLWGKGNYLVDADPQPHEAHWLKLDCGKAQVDLGWKPRYTIEQALRLTIDWYRKFYEGVSPKEMTDMTISQIKEYIF